MAQPQKQAQTDDRDWRSAQRIAALSTVLGSIYEQILLAFSRSIDNLESRDQAEVTDESDVVHQVADAVNAGQDAMRDTRQDGGRVVIQRSVIMGHPSQAEIEQAVQNALQRLGIPSRARVEKIGHELDELNDLLDQQLAARQAEQTKAQQSETNL